MFFDILYFISMTGFCMTTTGVFLYLYDRRLTTEIAYNMGQYGVNACANVLDFFEKIKNEEKDEDAVILYSNGQNMSIDPLLLYTNDIVDNDLVIFRKTVNNSTIYKIMKDINDFEMNTIEKPFLQVEITFEDEKIEIQNFLKKFYVSGNKFDKIFFKWFMEYFYNTKLGDTWELNIIDNSVNIMKLTQDNVIILNDNKYNIENI